MRIHAYVLIADPSFLGESIAAYYSRVDKIILSYDRTATSWTGTPIPVAQCLQIVADLDTEGKCVHVPGDFARLDHKPLENDTFQRQHALDAASVDADWVLQLDTDEVMADPETFFQMLDRADSAGAGGLEFPSRWLYTRSRQGRYLESSDRFWRPVAGYPGPLAFLGGNMLRHARQTDADLFRVDLRERSTDPARSKNAPVHATVSPQKAVLHFSWVRDREVMRRKLGWSGHAAALEPPAIYRRWEWRTRHPLLAALVTPLKRRRHFRLRVARIPEPPGGVPPVIELEQSER